MSQLCRSSASLAGAAIAASIALAACRSIDPSEPGQSEVVVAVSAFETLGDGQPAIARELAADLAGALNADGYIKARAEGSGSNPSRDYILNGAVYEGGQRAFVALQLLDAKTARMVWADNYDYRGIGADVMAADISKHLRTHAADD